MPRSSPRDKTPHSLRRWLRLEPHGSHGTASRSEAVPCKDWAASGNRCHEIRPAGRVHEKGKKKKKKESGKVKKQNVVAIVTLLKRSFQLEEKYPNLYGILQTTPIDEVIRRVDQDRLKTTYQLDYSERGKLLILWKIIGIYSFFNKKRNKSDSDVKIENENSIAIVCIFVRRKFQKVYMFSKLTNYLLKPSHVIEKLIF